MPYRWSVLLVFAIASPSLADTVVLTNGNRFEGELQEDTPKRVVIKVRGGLLTFPRHLVKSVTKEAKPKPKPKPKTPKSSGADKQGVADWGKGRNFWRDHRGDVKPGEVWHFKEGSLTGTNRFSRVGQKWQVERLRLDGVEFRVTQVIKDPKAFDPGVTPAIFTEEWPRAQDRRSKLQVDEQLKKQLAGAKSETLELAGRTFPCKVVVSQRKKQIWRAWVHYRDGRVRWPGMVQIRGAGKLLLQLKRIEPPPADVPEPPKLDARVGDRLVYETNGVKITRTVLRMCPSEVEMREERAGSNGKTVFKTTHRWKWLPNSPRGKPVSIRIAGRSFRVYEWKGPVRYGSFNRVRVAVDAKGRAVFPGTLEEVSIDRAGKETVASVLKSWKP
jgi:hypothetical protein